MSLTQYDVIRLHYSYGLNAHDMKRLPPMWVLRVKGWLSSRIACLEVSVGWALMIGAYILGNFVAMLVPLNGADMATNFGFLSGANACLLLIPATRNSLFNLLVRTISIEM